MKNRLLPNLKNFLTRNIGWKLLALFLSATLWFIINNINNPIVPKTFNNVKVEILNPDEITNYGKTYDVVDGSDIVKELKVSGRQNVMKELTKDDIKLEADMKSLDGENTLVITARSIRNNTDEGNLSFDFDSQKVQLKIEDLKTIQMVISTSTTGKPADGYVIGTVTPGQNIVRISGPESLVDRIDHVNAVAEITSAYSNDVNTNVELKLYDAENNEIKNNSLKLNISSINVNVTVLATKEVPIVFEPIGTPATGYILTNENISVPETITIAGRKQQLDNVNEIVITDDSLDVTGAKESITTILNMKKSLPNGVIFADSMQKGNVSVTIGIEKEVTKDLEIPKKNFAIAHIPEGYECTIKELENEDIQNYTISIKGISRNVSSIKTYDVVGVLDMDIVSDKLENADWVEGDYVTEIVFNLPDTVTLAKSYTMTVQMRKKGEE